MSLADLAQAVLLGTERGQPTLPESSADGALAEVLRQLEERGDGPVEQRVLSMAAVLAPYEEAGRRTLDVSDRALPPECPPEELPQCSAGAALVLRRILVEHKMLVPEWLSLAAAHGVRAPPSILPRLLQAGRHDASLHADLARAAGNRGLWLAVQNQAWSYLLAEATTPDDKVALATRRVDIWQEGRLAARKGYLKALRDQDAEAARRCLQEVWGQENAATRAALLSTLEVGLTIDDEPFLEDCLDDRSKQVRAAAAQLLGGLPDSRRARRMAERCHGCLRVKRGRLRTSLEIEIPEPFDASLLRDGLTEKQGRGGGLGKGAWRLMQLIAATPTSFWTDQLELEPRALLKTLKRHTWSEPMLLGLSSAAVREHDADLGLALLTAKRGKNRSDTEDLIRLLPAAQRDEFLTHRLQEAPERNVRDLLLQLEHVTDGPWSEGLARVALARLRRLMKRPKGQQDWYLHDVLKPFSTRLPVSLASDALAQVPHPKDPIPSLDNKLGNFAAVLDLRTRMHKELTP